MMSGVSLPIKRVIRNYGDTSAALGSVAASHTYAQG